ncbi:hypothetical protein [Paraburkholderia sp. BCC1886]|uniref:hypothetical protein n=1 Tax=Paraburkholderia sp. BCC1886 TaxID=2562670 RepID=UPI0011836B68|nr:hypothetical protein [Paraburkholderia sp. BCC1886]
MARPQFYQQQKKAPPKLPSIFRHSANDDLKLKLIPHQHLQAIFDRRGTKAEFASVAFRVIVGACLAVYADDQETLDVVYKAAIDSLIAVGERYQRVETFGLNGDEMRQLKDALNLTDEVQELTTRRQQVDMYKAAYQFVGSFEGTMRNLRQVQQNYRERDEAKRRETTAAAQQAS